MSVCCCCFSCCRLSQTSQNPLPTPSSDETIPAKRRKLGSIAYEGMTLSLHLSKIKPSETLKRKSKGPPLPPQFAFQTSKDSPNVNPKAESHVPNTGFSTSMRTADGAQDENPRNQSS